MVEPVTIAVLSGVGALASSVSGWLAARAAKKRKAQRAAQKAKGTPATRQRVQARPVDLPDVTFEEVAQKWLDRVKVLLASVPAGKQRVKTVRRARTGTQRAVSILNMLEPVFQAAFVLLLVWMVVQPFLALYEPEAFARIPTWPVFLLTAAAIGYGTNWIAIKMLFHPQRRNKVWVGVIPDRKDELVETISNSVIERLIGPDIIRKYLRESDLIRDVIKRATATTKAIVDEREFRQEIKAIVYDAVERFATSDETKDAVAHAIETKIRTWTGSDVGARFAQAFKGLWGPVLKREVIRSLPELPNALDHAFGTIDEKLLRVPEWLESRHGEIEEAIVDWISLVLHRIDLKPIIVAQLSRMSPPELEKMLAKPVSGELRFVQTSGGLFGLAVASAIEWLPARVALGLLVIGLIIVYLMTVEDRREQSTVRAS